MFSHTQQKQWQLTTYILSFSYKINEFQHIFFYLYTLNDQEYIEVK